MTAKQLTRFQTKPVYVYGTRVHKLNVDSIAKWCGGAAIEDATSTPDKRAYLGVLVPTPNGDRPAPIGYYVVRYCPGDISGYYVYEPAEFIKRFAHTD